MVCTFFINKRIPKKVQEIDLNILITGAAGFIGSAFVRKALTEKNKVVVLDKLTYAGHIENLEEVLDNDRCKFVQGCITDQLLTEKLLAEHSIDAVVNFAAESHVDNSIHSPGEFIKTNILGTFALLEAARGYWNSLTGQKKENFRFVHVSTDEVYGSLGDTGKFNEELPYRPNSPYSASKAGSDHLVRAWFHTYKLPTVTTNCSNNYGPRQFTEKLIPTMILSAVSGKPMPVYGNGKNVRDWIHVDDHSSGVYLALTKGTPGETYCFGGNSERNNLEVVKTICTILDEVKPRSDKNSYSTQIQFVEDRKGHDWRYAIDDSKAQKALGFKRTYNRFEDGLRSTVEWYLENRAWIQKVNAKKKV
jgi:dTDP-glucose 4,6-dehydratase